MGVDRVAMVSLRADGTPDQCDGFEIIGAESPTAVMSAPPARKRRTKAKP